MPHARSIAAAAACVLLAPLAHAEVAEVTAQGFLVKHSVHVNVPPAKAYEILTTQVGQWWNPGHTFSQDAHNLSLDARADGCFCEKLANGGSVMHMRVVYANPGNALRMVGAMGPLQGWGLAGAWTWSFKADATGTVVSMQYAAGGYMQGGFDKMAPAVNGMMGEQVARYQAFADTGKPEPAAAKP